MRIVLLLLLIVLNICARGQQPELQQKLNKILRDNSITGIQVAYLNNNNLTSYCIGKMGLEHDVAISPNTIFQAASLSKVVLAYIALRYLDRGIVSLDTPLFKYYKNPRLSNDSASHQVTARMVLTHTSGFPNWAASPSGKSWAKSRLTAKFRPGSAWSYSGEGFVFLQQLLETLTGKPLNQLASEEVFEPLQMKQSSFIWQQSFDDSMAYGNSGDKNESPRNQAFIANGAASLTTTASDYVKFLQAVCQGIGLQPATARLMLEQAVIPEWYGRPKNSATEHLGWGLGVGIETNKKGKAIWHWGDNGDFKCFFMAYPGTGEILVYLTNDENGLNPVKDVLTLFIGNQIYWSVKWLGIY